MKKRRPFIKRGGPGTYSYALNTQHKHLGVRSRPLPQFRRPRVNSLNQLMERGDEPPSLANKLHTFAQQKHREEVTCHSSGESERAT
ncbi:unnamed protein product [Dovyalis caffra]|uniref:Uncharacterized protein n=1 Tax=Dovyalis caffra TaxID=77055 RepID=A0AAV1RDJ5_9ROSI|nr:unnamed protein product [Dovyalis caffra]